MKNLRYFFLTFLCVASVYGQQGCDTMFESLRVGDGIIVSSMSGNDLPLLSKIDENGEQLWQTQGNSSDYYVRYMKLQLFSDGFLYVTVSLPEGSNYQVWKVNPATGAVAWKTVVYLSENDCSPALFDYKTDKLVFMYPLSDNNGGTVGGFKVITINRDTGISTPIYELNSSLNNLNMVMDSKGNAIYSLHLSGINNKTIIRKINGINFNNILWEKSYISGIPTVPTLTTVGTLIIDKTDDLYAFSSVDEMDLFKIDTSTGNEIWKINDITYDRRVRDFKFSDNMLYVCFQHIYVGSVYTSFEITKINFTTGAIGWSSVENHMTPVGASVGNGINESIYSFDLDCNGDVFATGYYADANYGPAAWGIMKLNGQTGAKISDMTVTNNPMELNTSSIGKGAFYFNSGPLFLGNLQYSENGNTIRTAVKTNQQLNSVLSKKYACIVDGDGDGIADYDENPDGSGFIENDDTDNDGIPNYLDPDDDGDGILTINEDTNGDGNPLDDYSDPTHPNIPDYLNPDIALSTVAFESGNLQVYPNPVQNTLYFKAPRNQQIQSATLFSVSGVLLKSQGKGKDNMDVNNLPVGIYFLKIETDSGTVTQKIIKE